MEGLDLQSLPLKGLNREAELRCCKECEDVCMARRQLNSKNDFKNEETSQEMKRIITARLSSCFTWQNAQFNSRSGKNLVFFFY